MRRGCNDCTVEPVVSLSIHQGTTCATPVPDDATVLERVSVSHPGGFAVNAQ
jgi:hypothetical protein